MKSGSKLQKKFHGMPAKEVLHYIKYKNGLLKEEIDKYLLNCGWFQDSSRYAFQLQPEEFIQVLLDEMIRSGAANWHNNHLIATATSVEPQKEWMEKNIKPKDWQVKTFLYKEKSK